MNIICRFEKSIWMGIVLASLCGCQARFLNFRVPQNDTLSGSKFQAVDYFTTPRPPVLCAETGWQYLQKEFFGPQCGSCHGNAPIAPYPFNSTDATTSYNAATSIPINKLLPTSQNNFFLPSTSHLNIDGDVYKGILEWTKHELDCP